MNIAGWEQARPGAVVSPDASKFMLMLKDSSKLENTIPPGMLRVGNYNGARLAVMPLRYEIIKILHNLGYSIDGLEPLRFSNLPKVEGKYDLLKHQTAMAGFLSIHQRAYITSTMRTGKTASTIAAACWLQDTGRVRSCLIICTVSNLDGVWVKEIEGMRPDKSITVIHASGKEKRAALLKNHADFYIINYDGVKMLKDELSDMVDRGLIDLCIVDELTHYANARSELWRAGDQVINGNKYENKGKQEITLFDGTKKKIVRRQSTGKGRAIPWVWGLTGTPGDPLMIYGQVKLITPERMQCSLTTWRDMTMLKTWGFQYKPKSTHLETIFQTMQPCLRFDKKDVMDLPPVVMTAKGCELSTAQNKLYRKLLEDMQALSDSNEKIVAINAASLVTKLLQTATGVVKGEDGVQLQLDMTPRLNVLKEIIESTERKVVIFAAYTGVIDRLVDEVNKMGFVADKVDGSVTGRKRSEIFNNFQDDENQLRVIICHPKTTAFGVELAAADTMVFFGPPMSGEFVYQQAIERMSSLKQKADSIQIIHLSAIKEERKLFKAIAEGVSINEAINSLFTKKIK